MILVVIRWSAVLESVDSIPSGAELLSFRVANLRNSARVVRTTLEANGCIYEITLHAPAPFALTLELLQGRISGIEIVDTRDDRKDLPWRLLIDSDRGHYEVGASLIVAQRWPLTTVPLSTSEDQIREMVADWFEAMAAKNFDKAFSMFAHDDSAWEWTPELLSETIRCYGTPGIDRETIDIMHEEWGVREFEVTSLYGRDDAEEIINGIEIEIDREGNNASQPDRYIGWVHFWGLPLCNARSDLTARFRIIRVAEDRLSLELLDIHVM